MQFLVHASSMWTRLAQSTTAITARITRGSRPVDCNFESISDNTTDLSGAMDSAFAESQATDLKQHADAVDDLLTAALSLTDRKFRPLEENNTDLGANDGKSFEAGDQAGLKNSSGTTSASHTESIAPILRPETMKFLWQHALLRSRMAARQTDIDRTFAAKREQEYQLSLVIAHENSPIWIQMTGKPLQHLLQHFNPTDPLRKSMKARWHQLTNILNDLEQDQNRDLCDVRAREREAVEHLVDVFNDYSASIYAQELLRDVEAESEQYTPLDIPHSIDIGVDSEFSAARASAATATGSSIADEAEAPHDTERVEECRERWNRAKTRVRAAMMNFDLWEADRLEMPDGEGYQSSEAARAYIDRGRQVATELQEAELAYSDAATSARTKYAVPTDMLSAHFPEYAVAEVSPQLKSRDMFQISQRVQDWVIQVPDGIDMTELPPQTPTKSTVEDLESIRLGESPFDRLQNCRTTRMIQHNEKANEEEFQEMLQNWPNDRIERPPPRRKDSMSSLNPDELRRENAANLEVKPVGESIVAPANLEDPDTSGHGHSDTSFEGSDGNNALSPLKRKARHDDSGDISQSNTKKRKYNLVGSE